MDHIVLTQLSSKEVKELIKESLKQFFLENPINPDYRQNIEEINRFISKKEAAELWGCCTSTIDNYARKGILKRHYIGSAVRFKYIEVLEVVEMMNNTK